MQNIDDSIQNFKKAIANECIQAMFKYGMIIYKGIEINQSKEEGLKYIKMSADKGYSDASFYYYTNIQSNPLYLKKAALKGHSKAIKEYGFFLVKRKEKKSI